MAGCFRLPTGRLPTTGFRLASGRLPARVRPASGWHPACFRPAYGRQLMPEGLHHHSVAQPVHMRGFIWTSIQVWLGKNITVAIIIPFWLKAVSDQVLVP